MGTAKIKELTFVALTLCVLRVKRALRREFPRNDAVLRGTEFWGLLLRVCEEEADSDSRGQGTEDGGGGDQSELARVHLSFTRRTISVGFTVAFSRENFQVRAEMRELVAGKFTL